MRICIVCFEMVGPFVNGGIGTAYTTMAETVAKDSDVTYLYVRPQHDYLFCRNESISYWEKYYLQKGVRLELLDTDFKEDGIKEWSDQWLLSVSSHISEWLLIHGPFDVVHFPEHLGFGYATLLARREDEAFTDSVIVVGIHGSHQWLREMHPWIVETPLIDHIERQSVEWADILWSPSNYMINWMQDNDWILPTQQLVRPYILPYSARLKEFAAATAEGSVIDEIVFFGRLEGRKGLALFCDAIEGLRRDFEGRLQVTFMGRHSSVEGVESGRYLDQRTKNWSWPTKIMSNLDQPAALRYLKSNNCVAVIASPADNSPNTVYECLGLRVPFIACSSGGIPELIAEIDWPKCTFKYDKVALQELLLRGLRQGFSIPCSSHSFEENEKSWISWHQKLADGLKGSERQVNGLSG